MTPFSNQELKERFAFKDSGFHTEARVIMYCKWKEKSVVVSQSISSSKYLFAISQSIVVISIVSIGNSMTCSGIYYDLIATSCYTKVRMKMKDEIKSKPYGRSVTDPQKGN